MAKNKNTKNSKTAKPNKATAKVAAKTTTKATAKPAKVAAKAAPKKDLKPQKVVKATKTVAVAKVMVKGPVAKELKTGAKTTTKIEVAPAAPVKEITKEAKEAARVAEERAMSLNLRSFRNQQDVEKFYRFVVENDLRREAKMVLDKIFVEVASQKKKRRAAAKKK
jgi:hypothetical protein